MNKEIQKFIESIEKSSSFKELKHFQNEYIKKEILKEINEKLKKNKTKLGRFLFSSQNEFEHIALATSKSWILHFDSEFVLKSIFGCDIEDRDIKLGDISSLKFQKNLIFVGFQSGYLIIYDPSNYPLKNFFYSEKNETVLILDKKGQLQRFQIQRKVLFKDLYVSNLIKSEFNTSNICIFDEEEFDFNLVAMENDDKEIEVQLLNSTIKTIQKFQLNGNSMLSWSSSSKHEKVGNIIKLVIGNEVCIQIHNFIVNEEEFESNPIIKNISMNMIHLQWLNENILLIIDSDHRIILFDSNLSKLSELQLSEYFDFSESDVSYQFSKNCFFLIQDEELIKFTLRNWRERIEFLLIIDEWNLAIETTISYLQDFEKENVKEFLIHLLNEYTNQYSKSISIWVESLNYALLTEDSNIVHDRVDKMLLEDYSFLEVVVVFIQDIDDKIKIKYFDLDFDLIIKFCASTEDFYTFKNLYVYCRHEYIIPFQFLMSKLDDGVNVSDVLFELLIEDIFGNWNIDFIEKKEYFVDFIISNSMKNSFEKMIKLNSSKFFKFMEFFMKESKMENDILNLLIHLIFNNTKNTFETRIYKSSIFSFENQIHFVQFLVWYYTNHPKHQIEKDLLSLIFKYLIENLQLKVIDTTKLEENLAKIVRNNLNYNVDVDKTIGFCEKLKFHQILCILYNEKGLIEKSIKSYFNLDSDDIFDYIEEIFQQSDSKIESLKKLILEKYLKSLLDLNPDRTVTQIIIPYFNENSKQKKILSILEKGKDSQLTVYKYLRQILKVEKKNLKIYLTDDLRYKYLTLLMKFNQNHCVSFIEEQNLKDFKKMISLCKENDYFLKGYLKNQLFEFKESLSLYLMDVKQKADGFKIRVEKLNFQSNDDWMDLTEYHWLFESIGCYLNICEINYKSTHFSYDEINQFYFDLFKVFIDEIVKLKYLEKGKLFNNSKELVKTRMKELIQKMNENSKQIENINFKIQFEKNEKLKQELLNVLNKKTVSFDQLKTELKIEKGKLKKEIESNQLTKNSKISVNQNYFLSILKEIIIDTSKLLNFSFIFENIFELYSNESFGIIKEIIFQLLTAFENEKEFLKLKNEIVLQDLFNLNEKLIKKKLKGNKIQLKNSCSKCDFEFNSFDKIRYFSNCDHYFHLNCIKNSRKCLKCFFNDEELEFEKNLHVDKNKVMLKYQRVERILNEKFEEF
eukprot:gene10022-2341_t